VPPPGEDITLEITYLCPLIVPFVNRVVYGAFVNFSTLAANLGIGKVLGSGDRPEEEAMVLPNRLLPAQAAYVSSMQDMVTAVFANFGYSADSVANIVPLLTSLETRGWYALPVRARCTLTVETPTEPMLRP